MARGMLSSAAGEAISALASAASGETSDDDCGGVAVLGRDRVVSDTEHTGMIKQSGPKMWVTTQPIEDDGCCVAMAGSGETLLLRAIRDRLAASVDPDANRHQAQENIESELLEFYEQNVYNYPDFQNRRQIQLVIAIRDRDGLALLQTSDHSLGPIDSRVCVGHGTDLGEFLLDYWTTSLNQEALRGAFDVMAAQLLAIYMLSQVKKYSLYCGGESQVLTIPARGKPVFMSESDAVALERDFTQDPDSPAIKALMMSYVARNPHMFGADVLKRHIKDVLKG